MVGGTRDKLKGRIEGLRYDGIWLMAQDSEGEKLAASADRSIRNVAWGIADMDEAIVAFKAVGAKTLIEPFVVADVVRVAFYEDPNGVSGELLPCPRKVRLIGRGQVGAGRVSEVASGHAACATVPRSHVRWLGEPPPRRCDRVSPGGESGPPGAPGPSTASPAPGALSACAHDQKFCTRDNPG